MDLQEARNDSVLHTYRASLAFRKSHASLTQGATSFLDLPEPVLGVVRAHEGRVLTCLFNLSERPLTLTLGGEAQVVGPHHAESEGGTVHLPAHGFIYLESAAALAVLPAPLGDPGSSVQPGTAS